MTSHRFPAVLGAALGLALALAGAAEGAGYLVPFLRPANGLDNLAGDSWTNGNLATTSRYPGLLNCTQTPCNAIAGIWLPLDNWVEQLPALTGRYALNWGYGGQTSGKIYENLLAGPPGATANQLRGNWTWFAGRNDVSKPGGEIWPTITDGTYSFTSTCTLNGTTSVTGCSPALNTIGAGGGVNGFAVSGTNIPAGDYVQGDSSVTTFTLATAATGSGSTLLTFQAQGATQFLSLIPHGRKLLMMPYGGGSIASTTPDWVRWNRLKWLYRRNHPQYVFETFRYIMGLSPNGSDGSATDDLDVANQALPSSGSSLSHPNWRLQPLLATAISRPLNAMAGRTVYALERTIPDVPYDVANGATIGQLYGFGNITSWALTSNDCSGCIAVSSSGVVTRNGTGDLPIVHATVTATGLDYRGNTVTSTNDLRILNSAIGAAASTPKGATVVLDPNATASSKRFPRLSEAVSPWTNNGKFTFVVVMKPATAIDSTNVNILVAGSNIIINRSSGNKIVISLKDSASGNVLSSWTSVTTNFTNANGYQTFLFSIDITGAGVISAWSVGSTGTATNIAPATAPVVGTGLINLAGSPLNFFVASASGASNFAGGIKLLYAIAGQAIDFSVSGNRALFVDGSGNPVDLGATCATPTSSQPEVCLRGAAGDFVTGKNFGSAPDFGWHDTWLSGESSSDPTLP